jgi:hypothetical protein
MNPLMERFQQWRSEKAHRKLLAQLAPGMSFTRETFARAGLPLAVVPDDVRLDALLWQCLLTFYPQHTSALASLEIAYKDYGAPRRGYGVLEAVRQIAAVEGLDQVAIFEALQQGVHFHSSPLDWADDWKNAKFQLYYAPTFADLQTNPTKITGAFRAELKLGPRLTFDEGDNVEEVLEDDTP